jgi:ADP-ribose pyrophosphatase
MRRPSDAGDSPLGDQSVDALVSAPRQLASGYRPYERYEVALTGADGAPLTQTRDLVRGGLVVAVLPVDLSRDEVVLIRQFRLAAHLANGRGGLLEIVAGRVEGEEAPAAAAHRECVEEIGVAPAKLVELFRYLTTPGITDEQIIVYLGLVDAGGVPERAGSAQEQEDIRPLRVAIDAALAALDDSRLHNGPLLIALQWLALNRHRLADMARAASSQA